MNNQIRMKNLKAAGNIDDYISRYPEPVQVLLTTIRERIRKAAPGATEKISYGMPAFALNGILVYFAAYSKHIGFYPTASGIIAFREELAGYDLSKGTVRFPLDRPLPLDLIEEIVKFRVEENLNKTGKVRSF